MIYVKVCSESDNFTRECWIAQAAAQCTSHCSAGRVLHVQTAAGVASWAVDSEVTT